MNSELGDLLAIGIPATGLGVAALALMIHQELGPFAGLDRAGKWLLSAAFGMGLLAFGLKMAVAVAIVLYGFDSGAALATVVGVLIEVPVMLWLVKMVNSTKAWYEKSL